MVWVAVVGPARGSCTKKERTCKACYKPFEMSSFSLLYHFQVHLKVTIDAPAWSQQMEGTQTSLLSHLYTPTTLFPHSDPLGCKKTTAKSLKLPRNRHHLRLVSLTKLYLNKHYQARLKSFSMYFSSKNTEAAHFPKNTTQIGIRFSYVHGHESLFFFCGVLCFILQYKLQHKRNTFWRHWHYSHHCLETSVLSPFNPFVVIILPQLKALYTAAKNNDNMFVCENACWPCVRQKSDWNTYGILLSHIRGSRCRHTCKNTHTHTQNKHSNPGLEKLSDDTAASITAKTFTLLFFNNPFIFLLSFLFILAFIFPLSWGRLSSETSSPQMVAVVYTPRVSTPKGTPDKTTFSIKMNESKVKRNRCTQKKFTKVFKKRIFHLSAVCLWDFSCLQPASLKRSYDWQQRGGRDRKRQSEVFTTEFLSP